MSALIMSLKATNGILNVFDDRAEISRKTASGIFSQGIKGDRVFFYKDLSGIEFRKPTIFANGYMKFITAGTASINASVDMMGMTTKDGMTDPNSLVLRAFKKDTPVQAEKAYHLMLEKIAEAKSNAPVISVQPSSNADELMKFKNLLDQGIITPEEFNEKKKQLLGL